MVAGADQELLERDHELERIERVLDEVEHGGRLVIVEGPGGIGKSRLLNELRARAQARGYRTGAARCTELERPYAFGATRQMLGPLSKGAAFAGAAVHAKPLFDGSALKGDAASDEVFARLHGLYWLCAELAADQPLVLLVDDLQWADAGSLAFAAFLRGRLPDVPVLLALATRPVADPPTALGELLADPAASVVRPRPLSPVAVRSSAARLLGGAPEAVFVKHCHEATGGNPLLLEELLREAAAEGLRPDAQGARRLGGLSLRGVSTVVLLRLSRLTPAAQALARAVAILGDGAELPVAAALAGVGEDAALTAAEDLVRAELLRDAMPLAYTHPIVRASVLEDLPVVARTARHRQAAALLRERHAPAERIAAQLLAAGGAAGAEDRPPLLAAARQAIALGDPADAVAPLRATLPGATGDERAELLLELAEAEAVAGEPAAVDHLQEVLGMGGPAERRARAAVQLGRYLTFVGDPSRAIDVLEAAERELPPGSSAAEAVGAALIGAAHATRSGARRLAGRLAELKVPAGPPRSTPQRMVLAALAFGQTVSPEGHAATAAALAKRALEGEDLASDPVLGGQVTVIAGVTLTLSGHHREAERIVVGALEAARTSGSATATAVFAALRSFPLLRLGRLAAAEGEARAALDLGRQVPTAGTFNHCALGMALLAALERGAAPHDLEALLEHPGVRVDADVLPSSLVLLGRGHVALAQRRYGDALAEFEACDSPDPLWGRDSATLLPWRSGAALVHLAQGDRTEAERLAVEEVALAEAFGVAGPLGAAQRVAALAAPPDRREDGLREAVATLEGADAPLELARARADLGAELRRRGQRTEARELLSQALAEAMRMGAVRLAASLRAELAALGIRPSRAVAEGRSLTPGEQRVAELAAAGLRNREIAQRLFLTEKTVETHLSATYRKLGLRTRRELREALPS